MTRAKRRVDKPGSTSPKDRSQENEDTIWVAIKTSTSSRESSGVLAEASPQKTQNSGSPDQSDPEKLEGPKGQDGQGNHHLEGLSRRNPRKT
jgi:hypothetical protein